MKKSLIATGAAAVALAAMPALGAFGHGNLRLCGQVFLVGGKGLHRRQGNQGKAVQEQNFVVVPAVDGREVPEQDPEADKSGDVREDHTDGRDDKVGAVAHLALKVLNEYLAVDAQIKFQSSFAHVSLRSR